MDEIRVVKSGEMSFHSLRLGNPLFIISAEGKHIQNKRYEPAEKRGEIPLGGKGAYSGILEQYTVLLKGHTRCDWQGLTSAPRSVFGQFPKENANGPLNTLIFLKCYEIVVN